MNVPDNVEFKITLTVDAPLDLVWKAHTEAARLKEWWGPKGLTIPRCTVDLRPGGLFHYAMEAADGTVMWGKFVYREIEPLRKLVYVVSFSDEQGGTTRHPMAPEWPLEMLATMEFEAQDGKTVIDLSSVPINATEAEVKTFADNHESMRMGYGGTFEQLVEYLARQ